MWDVHYDFIPPAPFDTLFDPDYAGSVTADHFESNAAIHATMAPRDLEHVIALYDGEIRYTDLHIGKLVEKLRALGVHDRTITVITSDHGEEFFEHGRKGHKWALYDETVRVPLVIRYPERVSSGVRIASQVRLQDAAPTILSLARVRAPDGFGSAGPRTAHSEIDLAPFVTSDSVAQPPPLPAFGDLRLPSGRMMSMRTDALKLIRSPIEWGGEELYDLVVDPGERSNVVAARPAEATVLREEHAIWLTRWESGDPLSQAITLSKDHEERLRALGYIR